MVARSTAAPRIWIASRHTECSLGQVCFVLLGSGARTVTIPEHQYGLGPAQRKRVASVRNLTVDPANLGVREGLFLDTTKIFTVAPTSCGKAIRQLLPLITWRPLSTLPCLRHRRAQRD